MQIYEVEVSWRVHASKRIVAASEEEAEREALGSELGQFTFAEPMPSTFQIEHTIPIDRVRRKKRN